MNIECYFIAFNEAETIHLTIKHYQSFCSKIVVYDNFSTDNTREIAESMGCEVRLFGIEGQLNDAEYLKVKNNCWKGSQADWVIVCDADEVLNLVDFTTAKEEGATIFHTFGHNMFSEQLPKESWFEVNTGIHDPNYSKCIVFNPKEITEINYQYGCHTFKPEGPQGRIQWATAVPLLLHYKHVGGAKRLADRHALYESRRSPLNKRWHMGDQYGEPREKTIKYFHENLAKSKPLW
jgi:glycosyltransferase involved in cell wall biosynthesis